MKTEEATQEARRSGPMLSRALQDLAPLSCEVIDARGRRVPLSSAGLVLHAGKKYRLRIVPANDDLRDVQIIAPPDFLKVSPEVVVSDERGRSVHDIPFWVRRDLGAAVYRFGNIRWDDLEICYKYTQESGKQPVHSLCPVVVRPGLTPVFLAMAGSVLSFIAPILLTELFVVGSADEGDFAARIRQWLHSPGLWLCLGIIAVLLGIVYGYSLLQLRQRSKELQQAFDDKYPLRASTYPAKAEGPREAK